MTPPENSLEPLARWVGEKIISFVSPSGKKVKEEKKRESTPSPPSSPESHLRKPPTNPQGPALSQTRPVPTRKLSRQSPFVPKSALREAAEVFEPHRQREREQMTPITQPAPRREPDIGKLIDKHTDLFPDEFPVLGATKTELSFSVQEEALHNIQDAMTDLQSLPPSRLAAPKNRQNTGSELRQRDKIARERKTREEHHGFTQEDSEWAHIKPPTPIPTPPRILPQNPQPLQIHLQSHHKELEHLLGHIHTLKLENKKDSRRRMKEAQELEKAAIDNEENDFVGDIFRPSLPEELARPPPRLSISNTSQSLPSSRPPNKNREVSRGRPRHRDGSSSSEEVVGGILATLNPYFQQLQAERDRPQGTAMDGKAKQGGKSTKSRRPPTLQPHGHRPKDENGMIPLMEGQVIVSRKLGEGGKVKTAPPGKTYAPRETKSTYPEKDNLAFALDTKEKVDSVPSSYKENSAPVLPSSSSGSEEEEKLPWTSQGRLERMRRLGPLPGYGSESEEEELPF